MAAESDRDDVGAKRRENVPSCRVILLDIEGTTTPITFVKVRYLIETQICLICEENLDLISSPEN